MYMVFSCNSANIQLACFNGLETGIGMTVDRNIRLRTQQNGSSRFRIALIKSAASGSDLLVTAILMTVARIFGYGTGQQLLIAVRSVNVVFGQPAIQPGFIAITCCTMYMNSHVRDRASDDCLITGTFVLMVFRDLTDGLRAIASVFMLMGFV